MFQNCRTSRGIVSAAIREKKAAWKIRDGRSGSFHFHLLVLHDDELGISFMSMYLMQDLESRECAE